MAKRATLRASDSDRERVADRLRHAAGEGRLLTEELEERLAAAFSARTYGELHAVVADLPVPADGRRRARRRSIDLPGPLWAKGVIAVAALAAALVLVAIAAAVIAGLFAIWLAWMILGWTLLGHRNRWVGYAPRRIWSAGGVGSRARRARVR